MSVSVHEFADLPLVAWAARLIPHRQPEVKLGREFDASARDFDRMGSHHGECPGSTASPHCGSTAGARAGSARRRAWRRPACPVTPTSLPHREEGRAGRSSLFNFTETFLTTLRKF